jgi:hypothetical protein
MFIDPIAGLARDLAHHRSQSRVIDLAGPATARADDVVVVRRLAADVGVFAGRQVDPLTAPIASSTSRVRKTVARPMPIRRARAAATSSAAVKWPSWSAMSAASARRGSVSR